MNLNPAAKPEARIFPLPLVSLTLVFLALPLVIFFYGWLKPIYALLAVAPILFCGWRLLREWPVECGSFQLREIGLVTAASFALTAFVGIGAFGFQDDDWIKHNAVLFDCVNLPWPVYLSDGSTSWALVYYLAYYLPAAVVGKIGGYAAAQVALWAWSGGGVTLSCLWFARLTRLPAGVVFFAFFAFSGLDFFANLLVQIIGLTGNHGAINYFPSQSWSKIWQFPSHYWMLQWSPGQALVAWLSAGLFLSSPHRLRLLCLGLLVTCAGFWSPFAGIGLFLLAILFMWRERSSFSVRQFPSMLGLIFPLALMAAFYLAKVSPAVATRFGTIPVGWFFRFHYAPGPLQAVLVLPLFIVLEFGILLWFLRARFLQGSSERNLANASGLALLFLLPVTVGHESDLAMRASAVPLFCLAVLLARMFFSTGLTPQLRRWLWVVVLIGNLTPLVEAARQGHNLWIGRHDPRTVPHQVSAVIHMPMTDLLKAQYVGSTNAFFSQHLARQQ
ncbi:MAG: hypothetical protein WCS94_25295 [Verrucomicrobiota bacterium]